MPSPCPTHRLALVGVILFGSLFVQPPKVAMKLTEIGAGGVDAQGERVAPVLMAAQTDAIRFLFPERYRAGGGVVGVQRNGCIRATRRRRRRLP